MRALLCLFGCGALLATAGAVMPSDQNALTQRTESFTIELNGSVAQVTPLFGPVREAEWAPSWKPQFIHPTDGAQRDGTVFRTVAANGRERLWLLTTYDAKEGRVDYVFVSPGFTINEINIRVLPDGDRRCKATVTYRHSALAPAGNEEVAKLDRHWAEQQRAHWESAINEALAKGGAHE